MKVGINDGCAHGGMMDSLSIHPLKEEKGWQPMYTVEVTEEEWAEWQAFLKLHNKWEGFWDKKMQEGERRKRGPIKST